MDKAVAFIAGKAKEIPLGIKIPEGINFFCEFFLSAAQGL